MVMDIIFASPYITIGLIVAGIVIAWNAAKKYRDKNTSYEQVDWEEENSLDLKKRLVKLGNKTSMKLRKDMGNAGVVKRYEKIGDQYYMLVRQKKLMAILELFKLWGKHDLYILSEEHVEPEKDGFAIEKDLELFNYGGVWVAGESGAEKVEQLSWKRISGKNMENNENYAKFMNWLNYNQSKNLQKYQQLAALDRKKWGDIEAKAVESD